MKIQFKKLHPDAVIPQYATAGAAGFDLVATEDVEFPPGATKLVKTGLAVNVGPGYEMQVRPRSGMSLKTPMRVANAPGTVDSDYRGEVCVIMTNTFVKQPLSNGGATMDIYLPKEGYQFIKKGDRVAQGVIVAVEQAEIEVVDELDSTERGAGGFGSTGK